MYTKKGEIYRRNNINNIIVESRYFIAKTQSDTRIGLDIWKLYAMQ